MEESAGTFHQVNATLCFAGCPTFVEMSFGRDGGFHLSWAEPRARTNWDLPRVFTATASLKKWKKYTANRHSPDFLRTQQVWLNLAHQALVPLCPRYFGG